MFVTMPNDQPLTAEQAMELLVQKYAPAISFAIRPYVCRGIKTDKEAYRMFVKVRKLLYAFRRELMNRGCKLDDACARIVFFKDNHFDQKIAMVTERVVTYPW